MNHHFQLLDTAKKLLQPLDRRMVFVGGATVSLHVNDPGAGSVRATEDVDLVVEVSGPIEYFKLEEQLRTHGFYQEMLKNSPLCRWQKDEIMLDVMPTDPELIGFDSSRWFRRGYEKAQTYKLPNGAEIEAFAAIHLLAAKIEAFEDRGDGDWLASPDVEDIATVLDGRTSIFEELAADTDPAKFVRDWLRNTDYLEQRLAGHVGGYQRASYLVDRLSDLPD